MLTGTTLERLEYIPLTGQWFWRNPPNHNTRLKDKLAGNLRADGYRLIRIAGTLYYSSRLAFLWMLGRWPYDEVDHEDRNPSNDIWGNLREATSSQNKYNRDLGHRSGYRGVYRSEDRWWAQAGGEYLGTFDTFDEAVEAREQAVSRKGVTAYALTDLSTLGEIK